MNAFLGKIFDTFIGFVNLFRPWVVLDEFERGIILRLGHFHKEIGPGFHVRRCFNYDVLLWLNIRKQTRDSWEMTLTSSDGKTITLSFDMVQEVFDVKKALLSVENWQQVAYVTSKIVISRLVASNIAEDIMKVDFVDVLQNSINVVLNTFGIQITQFGLTDKAFTKPYKFFIGPHS